MLIQGITMISEALQFDFMQNALIAGILVSIACGIIGTFVVINRIVFVSGGIAHAAYGGIGLGYYLNFSPVLGAVLFSILASLGMGLAQRKDAPAIGHNHWSDVGDRDGDRDYFN